MIFPATDPNQAAQGPAAHACESKASRITGYAAVRGSTMITRTVPWGDVVVMHLRSILLAFAVACLFAAGSAPVAAQLSSPFGRDAVALTPAETQAMEKSILEVLQSGKAGTVRTWTDADTKASGRATLVKAYISGNAKCGEVRHTLSRPGPPAKRASYTMPFCQQPDGSWKIAF